MPDDLRQKIRERIQAGPRDPRVKDDYVLEGLSGFFAFGGFAGIQWEQVMRAMQLHVLRMAKQSCGPMMTGM